ncbi:hypothetical protein H112_02756 [Trichophyton rubrum D6]|uniref:Uncharacterized protein n=2 Tax=Trichophyton TaxID=5550 RepID=A0A022W814_TRIRU|nr:hypothetical protein H100_02763 [Trichophyton rubrum MR850]EZF43807.1 hypothetical protein H102_02755 [Trichophyton rubrum CBS 100081]EZF54449.1 hypothetical protein H103_02767 [Trichophyton rubrum CBS 288.86]EZF65079.1 hypothetical protein H104_02746 [Trichophyton rubrum CBS 289.86]EZF75577.1 hypothetical protein H105_02772 [Trichophyton soudanense CBS 452.61]EZF86346.1 hypothetical protein H110_02765 [Trichophyton rubrum MR1448]EZG18614.1 hypothetical protein H107_02841 [Trichophyton rub
MSQRHACRLGLALDDSSCTCVSLKRGLLSHQASCGSKEEERNIQDDDKTKTRRQDRDTRRRTGIQESDDSRARLSYFAAGSKSLSSASALIKRKGPLRSTYAHHCGTEHGVPSSTCVVRWPVGWIESAQGGLTSRFSPFVGYSILCGHR